MAHSREAAVRRERGQVLAFVAVVIPIVLLPVVAYVVDAAVAEFHAADLQAATAQAAETAAQQLDLEVVRSGGGLSLDAVAVRRVAVETLGREDPTAVVDSVSVAGVDVTVRTSEGVQAPFALLTGRVTLRARASARLVAGYERPSSFLPLPSSSF